jgi:hypothetical protein
MVVRSRQRRYGSWCSGHRVSGRSPDFESPFCASAVLVRSDDRCVNHDVLEVGIICQDFEKTLPNSFARPTIEAHEHAVPASKLRRQVAPRRTGPQNPKHRIDEQPIVLARTTFVPFLTRNQTRDTLPLTPREFASNQDRLLQVAILNHNDASEGIPNVNRA